MTDTLLTIERLGHRGDGIAMPDGQPVYVPFALPGETVRAEVSGERGDLFEIVTASPDRVAPPCRHFGRCGGCLLQHMAPAPYADFKRDLVAAAFADRGLVPEIAATVAVPPGSRRRVVLAAGRAGRHLVLGFHARRSHTIIDIAECPIAVPAIVAALPALREIAAIAMPKKGELTLTVVAGPEGLDVAIGGAGRKEADRLRLPLSVRAMDHGFARLSLGEEVIVAARPPAIPVGSALVVPPPGGFLQAAVPAEAAMAALVVQAAEGAKRVADLFAGAGTFALRLAATARVHAVEGDAPALEALTRAARAAPGLKPVTTERRDLFHRPLAGKELDVFDAVSFDPPRAGAAEQAAALAASKVPVVVAVSCNPATLARDARLLIDGGYRLDLVTPVDQFLWTPHVEAVAVFRR
ncbi:class I SAM-dependent RNA methyltransferase [Methylobrevis albus]|uniref:Class I SAM-dependent RNA methyltransferase n=1 Tax=Methylobrevis albus TaxID=2793297 RepID=A0A931I1K6_9HYPH|nr:class I SAM-dependent RNA methyltransferase [Methylobrevis albus]MBH0238122.1 class I SAM-dependent RNA methyltransferase [Methylobrevis albus]